MRRREKGESASSPIPLPALFLLPSLTLPYEVVSGCCSGCEHLRSPGRKVAEITEIHDSSLVPGAGLEIEREREEPVQRTEETIHFHILPVMHHQHIPSFNSKHILFSNTGSPFCNFTRSKMSL